jgi:hypothetical protein
MALGRNQSNAKRGMSPWKAAVLAMVVIVIPWALYVNIHPRFDQAHTDASSSTNSEVSHSLGQLQNSAATTGNVKAPASFASKVQIDLLPVLGPVPTDGAKPLFGIQHKGTDAIFALAANYPKLYYQRFAGSLRKAGYVDDIVLAVSTLDKMKTGVKEYITEANILAYAFDVDCAGPDNCKLQNDFLGYPDPRPHRTFANIRYALYEYWLRHYGEQSYILILDFRDTFFQANPFAMFGEYGKRTPKYELQVFAENYKVSCFRNRLSEHNKT